VGGCGRRQGAPGLAGAGVVQQEASTQPRVVREAVLGGGCVQEDGRRGGRGRAVLGRCPGITAW